VEYSPRAAPHCPTSWASPERRRCFQAPGTFDLVDGRDDTRLRDESRDVLRREVGHADGPDMAALPKFDQGLPRLDIQVPARDRPVNQIEVDDIDLERRPAALERRAGRGVAVIGIA
jgi:hypothetical protein